MAQASKEGFREVASRKISSKMNEIIDEWKASKEWFCKPHSQMSDKDIEEQGSNLLSHLIKYVETGEKDELLAYVREDLKSKVSKGYRPEDVEDAIRFWNYLIVRTLRPEFEKEDCKNRFAELISGLFDEVSGQVSKEARSLYLAELELRVEERTRQLKESEKGYRELVDNALVGVYKTTLKGELLYVNEALASMFGFDSPEEMISEGALARYKDLNRREVLLKALKKEGKVTDFEVEVLTRTGKTKNILVSAHLDGDVFSGMVIDITERMKAERRLQRNEERLKILFDHAPDAYVLMDEEGIFVDGNKAAERLFGYKKEEGIGQNLLELGVLPPEEMERATENLLRTIQGEITGPDEFVLARKDGSPITVETRTFPVTIAGQELILAIARDITEQKKAEEAKNTLLSNTSHELRTPLTSIEGYAKFMLSGKIGKLPEKHEKCLKIIVEESDRLRLLIDNFLDLITIDIEGFRMDMKEVSIAQIIDRLASSMKMQLEEKGISISRKVPTDLGYVRGDAARLRQLFSNLLDNAIKFTPSGGSIEVRSITDDSSVMVEVADSGIGIPSKDLPHVFERFYQSDGSPTRKFKGVGLGLAICSEIVEAHGGHIEVESKLGKGSVFRVTLPKSEEAKDG